LLELEISERTVMQNPELGVETMHALLNLGVRLTIDDVGVGPLSLSHLTSVPVSKFKLDRSFVQALPDDVFAVGTTRAVIAIAHTLGIEVVAEGVEHEAQLELLRAERCDEFQGYLCQPALTETALLRFIDNRSVAVREPAPV
jgi:EAL domain-containing protein (putative c-di-GMP-specific phosphodiesterase class I)